MPRIRALAFLFVVQTALMVVLGVLLIRAQEGIDRQTRGNHALALISCRSTGELARIERAFIEQQSQQTKALLTSGVTFGIPKALLPKLLAQNSRTQARFLSGLDRLTVLNCAPGRFAFSALEGVRPGKEPLGLAGAGVPERLPSKP